MNHHPAACRVDLCERIEAVTDGVLSAQATSNDSGNLAPAFLLAKCRGICKALWIQYQDNALYEWRGVKHIDGARKGDAACEWCPELILSFHAAAGTGG